MVKVSFTQNLQRHVDCPAREVSASTVKEALEHIFQGNERARLYVLDEHGEVRKHMVIFVDGTPIQDRKKLSDPVGPQSEIYVMQALSGG